MNTDQPVIKRKRGRPEHPRTREALEFLRKYPSLSQKAAAKAFGISYSVLHHAVARHAPRCEHCGGKL